MPFPFQPTVKFLQQARLAETCATREVNMLPDAALCRVPPTQQVSEIAVSAYQGGREDRAFCLGSQFADPASAP